MSSLLSEWSGAAWWTFGYHGVERSGQVHSSQHPPLQELGQYQGKVILFIFNLGRDDFEMSSLYSGAGKSTLTHTPTLSRDFVFIYQNNAQPFRFFSILFNKQGNFIKCRQRFVWVYYREIMVPDAGFKSKNAPDTGTDTVVGPDIRPARFPVWSDSIYPACHIPV